MLAETRGAVEGARNFLVAGFQTCASVGIVHPQTAGLMADNHFILDAVASQSSASRKWFPNHGEWLKSKGRAPHVLEPGLNVGYGNVAQSKRRAKTEICVGGNWIPVGIPLFVTLAPNPLSCPASSALGSVIDTFRCVLDMSKIVVAVKLFESRVGN